MCFSGHELKKSDLAQRSLDPCFMRPQPTRKTSDTDVVKKPSLYWCEAVQSKSGGSKRLKTVSAQKDQTRVSPHPDGSGGVGFTIHTGCR